MQNDCVDKGVPGRCCVVIIIEENYGTATRDRCEPRLGLDRGLCHVGISYVGGCYVEGHVLGDVVSEAAVTGEYM